MGNVINDQELNLSYELTEYEMHFLKNMLRKLPKRPDENPMDTLVHEVIRLAILADEKIVK